MNPPETRRGDLGVLLLLAAVRLALHALTNHQYGFHRDELALLDDARHLAWGYVAYPPLTPFLGRVALELFGPSLVGLRLFSAAAQSAAMVLAGLMARELGGGRRAQVAAALAAAAAPISLIQGALFQYVSFDILAWVVLSYLFLRLLRTGDGRWWLAIGAAAGFGWMTKYTAALFCAALVAGLALSRRRRLLLGPWPWAGAAVALAVALPNLLWQIRHGFVSLEFLRAIHARDVALGRTEGFLVEQCFVASNLLTVPIWLGGLYFYLRAPGGGRYRALGWAYLLTLAALALAGGRSYYLAPAYPMLLAAGAVFWEQRLSASHRPGLRPMGRLLWIAPILGILIFAPVMLPLAPVHSPWWNLTNSLHDNFAEEIGWDDLAMNVAGIYRALPEDERARSGILASNYGEAGALNLYGPALGLPEAICGTNSYWERGYGDLPPEVLIVIGFSRERVEREFAQCRLAGRNTNRHGVENEETRFHLDIFVCRGLRRPWPEFWRRLRSFS